MMDESKVRVWWGGWWVRDWERGESFVFDKERMSETEKEKHILTRDGNKKYYLLSALSYSAQLSINMHGS